MVPSGQIFISHHYEARTSPGSPSCSHILPTHSAVHCLYDLIPHSCPQSKTFPWNSLKLNIRRQQHFLPHVPEYSLTSYPLWILDSPRGITFPVVLSSAEVAILSPPADVLVLKLHNWLNSAFWILKACTREPDVAGETHLSVLTALFESSSLTSYDASKPQYFPRLFPYPGFDMIVIPPPLPLFGADVLDSYFTESWKQSGISQQSGTKWPLSGHIEDTLPSLQYYGRTFIPVEDQVPSSHFQCPNPFSRTLHEALFSL